MSESVTDSPAKAAGDESARRFFESAMEGLAIPVLAVDVARQVRWMNHAARELVRVPEGRSEHLSVAEVLGLSPESVERLLPAEVPPAGSEWGPARVDTVTQPLRTLNISRSVVPAPDDEPLVLLAIEGTAWWEEAAAGRMGGPRMVLFETDPDGTIIHGAESLAVALGWNANEGAFRTVLDLIPPSHHRRFKRSWKKVRDGSPVRDLEGSFLGAKGSEHPFSLSLFPVSNLHGEMMGVRGVAHDMGIQKGLAYALEAAEERFGALFREASDPILILSLAGEILSVNDTFEVVTGIRSDELFRSEKSWNHFILRDDVDALMQAIEACRDESKATSGEARMVRADGEAIWFEHRITVLHDEEDRAKGFLIVARNIHDRKQLEQQLRQTAEDMQERNARAQALIDRLKQFFTQTSDLPSGIHAFLDGICEILSEMYEPTLLMIQTQDGQRFVRQDGNEMVEVPVGIPSAMCRRVMESGSPLVLHHLLQHPEFGSDTLVEAWSLQTYCGAALRDSTGQIRGTVALFDRNDRPLESTDVELITVASLQIAARLRSEEQDAARRDLESHLRQAQKMESLGLLAGGVAHDFNNILSGILGFSSYLLGKVEEGSPIHRDLGLIEKSAERAADLTRQLLAFARRKHFPKEPVSINQVIDETLLILRRTLAKNVRIETDVDEDLPDVLGDMGQLGQVMMNLCINAAEAMAVNGGTLRVQTGGEIPEDHVRKLDVKVGTSRPDFVCIRVRDGGAGMTEDTLAHVFDPFFTTKNDKGGTGLGLSIVYGIVTNHGGDIMVETEIGKGTEFTVYLPVHSGGERTTVIQTPEDLTGTETILVVDDELIVRQMVTEVLKGSGYSVIAASSGNHAVDLLPQLKEKVDLVLLDMVMPGMDGAETYSVLKVQDPTLPVLLTSGFAQEEVTDRLLKDGAKGLVYKPYKSTDLLAYVRRVLDESAAPS